MDFTVQWRLAGDEYGGGFTNGFSLTNGESVRDMTPVEKSDDKTVFKGKHGHRLTCFHKTEKGVTFCKTLFENLSGETSRLELLSSFAINGISADRMYRAQSFWSAEGKLLRQDLTELDMEPSWAKHGVRIEKFGQTGSMPVRKWFPFLVLENSADNSFLGVQLYCPSSWQIEVLRRDESVYITGGLADRDFGQWYKDIKNGECFESPRAVLACGKSLYEVCDKLVKAQSPKISPTDADMPVIFNEYCTSWGNPTLENIKKTAEKLEGTGVKYLVMDSGWYRGHDEDDWFSMTGDWIPSSELFPNGIKEAADTVRQRGMIPGIWYEFECAVSMADIYGREDMLLKRDGVPVTVGGRRFLDMRKDAVREFLDSRVTSLLKEAGFGYIKVDYNENTGVGVDGAESYGEGLRQSVLATQDFFSHLTEEIPDLAIENCSSGGHRLEPSFMELCSQASFSDAHECKSIPLIGANLQRLIRPEQCQIWAVLRAEADLHRINFVLTSAFFGRLCLSGEVFDLDEKQWRAVREAIAFYEKIKHIIKDGFTSYIYTNVSDYSAPEGYQAALRELDNEALLLVHTFENGANPPVENLLNGYEIAEEFGSDTDGDFRGKAYLLRR